MIPSTGEPPLMFSAEIWFWMIHCTDERIMVMHFMAVVSMGVVCMMEMSVVSMAVVCMMETSVVSMAVVCMMETSAVQLCLMMLLQGVPQGMTWMTSLGAAL